MALDEKGRRRAGPLVGRVRELAQGQITIDALVVRGSGVLAAVRGHLRFVGVTDAAGVGTPGLVT